MGYTSTEITRISADKLAIEGNRYIQDNGNIFVGTSDRRLKQIYTSGENITVQPDETVNAEQLNTYLTTIKSFNSFTQEFLDSYKWAQKTGYKVFTYDLGNLTTQEIYTDNSLSTILFSVSYSYTGDNLTTIVINKPSTGFTLTKNLYYDIDNNLTNIAII